MQLDGQGKNACFVRLRQSGCWGECMSCLGTFFRSLRNKQSSEVCIVGLDCRGVTRLQCSCSLRWMALMQSNLDLECVVS